MPTVDVLNATGKKTGTRELPDELFAATVSVPLMHQVVLAGMASLRRGTHKVKTRGEVRGGGKKPWRQKGTGRARQGSTRAPQWTGGGVVHGPQPRDHSMRVNKKMKKAALRGALTDTLQSGKLVLVDDLAFDEPKTKRAAETIAGWNVEGKILLILEQPTDTGAVEKSFRNVKGVRIAYAKGVGVYELIAADKVILTASALDALSQEPTQERASEPPATGSRNEPQPSTNATGDPEQAEPTSATPTATADDEDGDDE
jgi:large subunit ribosomal protein L4